MVRLWCDEIYIVQTVDSGQIQWAFSRKTLDQLTNKDLNQLPSYAATTQTQD